jgi:hypothetical protein
MLQTNIHLIVSFQKMFAVDNETAYPEWSEDALDDQVNAVYEYHGFDNDVEWGIGISEVDAQTHEGISNEETDSRRCS